MGGKSVAVFGASGQTGVPLVVQALNDPDVSSVKAIVRNKDKMEASLASEQLPDRQVVMSGFFLAIFSKLKGGKTQRFSKLKQIFCKTQGKYLKTQYFGNFCCGGPLQYCKLSNNDVITTILLHNAGCTALTS